jgi:16S rRNA processing protein RimM
LKSVKADAPQLISVARVLAPQGNRGEVRVQSLSDNATRLLTPGEFVVSPDQGSRPTPADRVMTLERGRPHGKFHALKFAGIASINDAETLRDMWVKVPRAELPALPAGEYYLFEIIGLSVVDEDGKVLGKVDGVMRGKGADVYVVQGPRGELLLPAAHEVVLAIDVERGVMTVRRQDEASGGEAK